MPKLPLESSISTALSYAAAMKRLEERGGLGRPPLAQDLLDLCGDLLDPLARARLG